MRSRVEIENIEEMRRQEGIEDTELWKAIYTLRVGDFVRVTLVADTVPAARETLRVRITSIAPGALRGRLADQPAAGSLAKHRRGALLNFSPNHIHSITERS